MPSVAVNNKLLRCLTVALGLAAALPTTSLAAPPAGGDQSAARLESSADATGILETLSVTGRIDRRSSFFQSLGTNGRACSTCHAPEDAFGLSAAHASRTFQLTRGQDPLLSIPFPADAQFTISVVQDPYGCAIIFDPKTGREDVSVYRRPLPATNLAFLSSVMSDGRETILPLGAADTFLGNLVTDLKQQAADATTGHAQAISPPTDEQLTAIVRFELGLYTAQSVDQDAGRLRDAGAQGGVRALSDQEYFPGINDSLGDDPTGAPFNPTAMTLFAAWAKSGPAATPRDGRREAARRAISAGERIFDTAPLAITDVRGLNDDPTLGSPRTIMAHCSTCHDAPNVGDHSLAVPLDIGTSHSVLPGMESDPRLTAALARLDMPQLPVYLISGCPDAADPGRIAPFYTSDPGRALITGKCADLNRIKGPILRGLAARAPYFHNGAAANLGQLVSFYDERFQMHLTPEEKSDLVAFLASL
jgi:hypothetical protein